ncbi:MAG TPA: peptidylprolyl isomerase [Candidatus Saccharimonadales bacterium]|nr:peptidylprolyl isomerase [Candidatus Saccharimonadales bacterium]
MKKIRRKFNKKVKKVRDLVPENAIDKAAASINPLAENQPAPLSDENVPQITNETIAEHREEVLKGARKYIYPLQHSKHRIIVITTSIVIAAIIGLLTYCVLGLYKYYQYNAFLYRVTQVVPFPIARTGGTFVNYENYLFELRHYVHYYQSQQQASLSDPNYKAQLLAYRKQALNDVTNLGYVKKLASEHKVGVSGKEVNTRITEVRNQNRLGSNDKVFADVLRDYWGWSISDFKRSLKNEILAEKVAAKLDTATQTRAQSALAQLKSGADFSNLAKQVSDDPNTKPNGGDYSFGVTKTNPNVPPQVIEALFKLQPGQISDIIIASPVQAGQPTTLEIVKLIQSDGTTVSAQHISFNLKDISTYINGLKAKQPVHNYVKF